MMIATETTRTSHAAEPATEAGQAALVRVPEWGAVDGQGVKQFPCHDRQWRAVTSTTRFTAAIAGTGGGKTACGPLWVAHQIARIQQQRNLKSHPILGMVVAPTYPVLARATAPTLCEMFRGTDLAGRYVPSQSQYFLPRDMGVIWMLGADRPGGLEGGQFDFVWVDEGGQCKYTAWIAIQGRVGQKQAPVLITTTPYGENWLYHDFHKRWQAGDPNYVVYQWSSNANPAYPDEEYRRAKQAMGANRAAQRYDGKFVRLAGLVYPDLRSCALPAAEPPPEGRRVGGVDFGWNNPFAALGATLYHDENGDDILYVFYERYKRSTTVSDHGHALPDGITWYADPSAPESITQLRRAGHKVRKATNAIAAGIDAVNERIYTGRLKISPACRALLAEAEEYRYPEKDDEILTDTPLAENDHAMDALRYLCMGVRRKGAA